KDGVRLIAETRMYHPNIKIIAISGGCSFFSLAFLEAANKLGVAYRLAKPFQGEQLI
ncbi:MAG: response regulator, partial [Gammaproteobacteria bacterium]|nr:response regulator [Gammaproteobacteria bacterium]